MGKFSRLIYISSDESQVKQIKISKNKFWLIFSITLIAFLVSGKYALDVIINFSHNSRIENLRKNNEYLQARLNEMNAVISNISSKLAEIESKDDELRTILGLPELNDDIRDVGIGGSSFEYNLTDDIQDTELSLNVRDYMESLDKLHREVKLETSSYTELINTYYAKEDTLKYLPALHPVLEGRISSNMGMRLHPVLKVWRKHPGIDISAKKGTPIYAAADGVIRLAKYNGGYGNCVFIDHKYGYETRYGHMSKILVRAGQKVRRGDKIGLVGKTGLATASHLHYEVLHEGREVDPKKYFFNDFDLNNLVINRE